MAGHRGLGVVRSGGAGDVRGFLSRHSDLALAGLVISIVAMMIVPLPAVVLDLLISLNIAAAVTLLLISIYVTDALRIATFPTLLLLTTLFRLALQVSATRLILSKANAGEVIHAFGAFVVAGNLVVGAVMFVILTTIQFIVIAKGAERVAEVAARFTLDALPGRQLAIDADLRAGHIDRDEAGRRRTLLARESQLFGSMDGAMKFVKGDAIAGLIILAVNIVGGLIIGTLQRGLDLTGAARVYTLLTIGEGLVAQLPALVISTAAGIIVTRVASEGEDGERAGDAHLGREIADQVLAHPKALTITAVLLVVLAAIPGLPAFPFLALAAVLGFVAYGLFRATARENRSAASPAADVALAERAPAPLLVPLEVLLGAAVEARLCPDGDATPLARRLADRLRDRLFGERGIPLPPLRVRLAADVPDAGYVVAFDEIVVHRSSDVAAGAGNGAGPDEDEIVAALWTALQRYGHRFVDIEATQTLLASLQKTHPTLVREVVPKVVSTALLADVLRRLAREGVSLRGLNDVLGALAASAPGERDATALTERARAALRRAITQRLASRDGVLRAYTLDPLIEDAVRGSITSTGADAVVAMEPTLSRDIVRAIGRAVERASNGGPPPVILTSVDVRRHLRRLIEVEHPDVAILAYPELAAEASVQPLGPITA